MQFFSKVKEYFSGPSAAEAENPDKEAEFAPGGGVGVRKKKVLVPRQPVLQNAGYSCKGGVQGLDWYKASLKMDVDGDLADEFLIERSRKNDPPDKPFRVQHRNVRNAALQDADLLVDHGSLMIVEENKATKLC